MRCPRQFSCGWGDITFGPGRRAGCAPISRRPLLGAFAVSGSQPQAQHVAFVGEIHAGRHVHGPVGDPRVEDRCARCGGYGEQGDDCARCSTHFEKRHLEVDHIIAVTKGGTDYISNLQMLCDSCNRIKDRGCRGGDALVMTLQNVVTIAGAVAAVEFLIRGLREWQEARRIVPIAALDTQIVKEWGLVPTQFAGSRCGLVRALLGIYGFLFVTPRTRKSVFLCKEVTGTSDERGLGLGALGPGDSLHIVLDDGERAASFVKALRRGGSGGYRTIAVRDLDDDQAPGEAQCVTVRTSGTFMLADDGGTTPAWLRFEAVAAAPRSRFGNGSIALAEVPEHALHLVLANDAPARPVPSALDESRRAGRKRPLQRWNANPWFGFAHRAVKYGVVFGGVRLAGAAGSRWEVVSLVAAVASWTLGFAIVLMVPVAVWRLRRGVSRDAALSTQRAIQRAGQSTGGGKADALPTQLVSRSTPALWLGATARCQSVGRKCNRTDIVSAARRYWGRVAYKLSHARHNCRLIARRRREFRARRQEQRRTAPPQEQSDG